MHWRIHYVVHVCANACGTTHACVKRHDTYMHGHWKYAPAPMAHPLKLQWMRQFNCRIS